MANTFTNHFNRQNYLTKTNTSFNRYFLTNSRTLLIGLGFALLYCLFYGCILVHEFRKMGIIDIILNSR